MGEPGLRSGGIEIFAQQPVIHPILPVAMETSNENHYPTRSFTSNF